MSVMGLTKQSLMRKKRRERGKCPQCGKDRGIRTVTCDGCASTDAARKKSRYQARVRLRLCGRCGGPRDRGRLVYCGGCAGRLSGLAMACRERQRCSSS